MSDHLTAQEEQRLRSFKRGRWIRFWSLAVASPVVTAATLLAAAGGGRWTVRSAVATLFSLSVPLLLFLLAKRLWTQARRFQDLGALRVTWVRGAFRLERTRGSRGLASASYFIGDTPVELATPDLRRKLTEREPCAARVVGDGPCVVVDVHPAH